MENFISFFVVQHMRRLFPSFTSEQVIWKMIHLLKYKMQSKEVIVKKHPKRSTKTFY